MSNHIISLSAFADYDMSLLLAASGVKELTAVVSFEGAETKTYFLVKPGYERFDTLGAAIDAYNAIDDGGSR